MPTPAENKWIEFWCFRLRAKTSPESYWTDLLAHYSEPHRAYHNLAHIMDCLEQFESAKHLAQDAVAVEMAIWYHDAVYDPRAKDNEERSAELAVRAVTEAGLRTSYRENIQALILATKKHDASLARDAAVLVDVDLSILGQNSARFDEYERQIRREYNWVSEVDFANGRAAVLGAFLSRPNIYTTEFFRAKYERQARENLQRSIQQLRQ